METKEDELQEEEYDINDGLGDLLRTSDPASFSWTRTIVVSLVLVSSVFLVVGGTFKLWNSFTASNESAPSLNKESSAFNLGVAKDKIKRTFKSNSPEFKYQPERKLTSEPLRSKSDTPQKVGGSSVNKQSKRIASPADNTIQSKQFNKRPVSQPKKVEPQRSLSSSSSKSFKVIAGSFSSYSNANRYKKVLGKKSVDGFVRTHKNGRHTLYIVQVGSFSTFSHAQQLVSKLKTANLESYILEI